MKCVGLLIFVLLVQSVDKFLKSKNRKWDDFSSTTPTRTSHAPENIDSQVLKQANYDEFRSGLNKTHGILIPNDLLLTVPLSEISENLLKSFRSLQHTLSDLSGCELETLSSVAANLFESLNKFSERIGSLSEERSSLSNAIPGIFLSITDVVDALNIGTGITNAVVKIKTDLLEVIEALDELENSDSNITKKLNDAVFPMAISVQVVIVSIAVIAESTAGKVATIETGTKEALVSLTLILQAVIVIVQSISSSIASTIFSLPERITPTSSVLNSFLLILDRSLPSTTDVITSITSSSISSSMTLIVNSISLTLSSLTYRLSESMEKLQTGVMLENSNTLENILFKFIGSEADFVSYLTSSTATITSSLSAISSSDSGLQSKISRQVYPVFQTLLQLTGSENDIETKLTSSLPAILEVLKSASNSLFNGLGIEITVGLVEAIEKVFVALQQLASKLNQEKIAVSEMDNATIECAKSVQVLGSVVDAIAKTIALFFDSVNAASLEVVIALPIIHSTVLYVVEWVTVVASSVFLTNARENHELVSSLAVTIVIMLKHNSNVLEMIAAAATQNSSDVVQLIAPAISKLKTVSASITDISKIKADTKIKIEQISHVGRDVYVEDDLSKAEGNLTQILNGLTGSLSSISSTLSSSLNSLKNSLNQIKTSEFEMLQAISGSLLSITTKLSDISGSATQVFHSTSNSLYSIFGNLLGAMSKVLSLGELVISLSTSTAHISNALHSFLYAINSYKVTAWFLIQSVGEIAKTVQILIATFSAIIISAADAGDDVLNKVSLATTALQYIVSTIILVVQQVLGAAVPIVSGMTGTIYATQQKLTLSMSTILEKLTFITADVTIFLADGNLYEIPGTILSAVSNLRNYTTESLSRVSGVVANIQVTLGLADKQS